MEPTFFRPFIFPNFSLTFFPRFPPLAGPAVAPPSTRLVSLDKALSTLLEAWFLFDAHNRGWVCREDVDAALGTDVATDRAKGVSSSSGGSVSEARRQVRETPDFYCSLFYFSLRRLLLGALPSSTSRRTAASTSPSSLAPWKTGPAWMMGRRRRRWRGRRRRPPQPQPLLPCRRDWAARMCARRRIGWSRSLRHGII